MKTTEAVPDVTLPRLAPTEFTSRLFWPVLLAITLLGFLLRFEVGRETYINFDEWQHLFMAASARWSDLAFELKTNAHPPLYFLLLRGIVRLGWVPLYRSISVLAGAGSVVIFGLIARRTMRSSLVQLLSAAAFALSADAIAISVEIRSYQLTIFLILIAFLFWLDMLSANRRILFRSCLAFAIFASLAVFCHYSAIFFLCACFTIPVLLAVMSPALRRRWILEAQNKSIFLAAAALAIPLAVFAVEYIVHIRFQLLQGYDVDFYRGGIPGESATSFVLRNSRNFLNLFFPFEFQRNAAAVGVIALLFAVAIWVLIDRWPDTLEGAEDRTARLSTAPILFAIVIICEIVAASLARKYPFGGMLRHQYVAGPFLLMAAFVCIDTLLTRPGRVLRGAIPALLVGGLVVNLVLQWPKLIVFPGAVIYSDEFRDWRSALPDTRAVYLDHWGVIGWFIHTSDRPRRFVRRIPDQAVIDEYHVPFGTPDGTEIFYDKTRDNLDLEDSSVYRSFADCLRGSGVKELGLFYFRAGDGSFHHTAAEMETLISQNATKQGLTISKIVVGKSTVFAAFRLRDDR